jgi:alpha-ketoglutarate-dependent 2,4-dichlorophenoxyacetate dioxygenase
MAIQVHPIIPGFVVELCGLDLQKPLGDAAVSEIKAIAAENPVLLFSGQSLNEEQRAAFGRQFGPLDTRVQKGLKEKIPPRLKTEELLDTSNIDLGGAVASRDHDQTMITLGNMMWHSDGASRPFALRYSMLFASQIPSWGGNTEFADLRAAYDGLDERTKALIANMVVGYSVSWSREIMGLSLASGYGASDAVAWRPLVEAHAESGRKTLRASIYATEIEGMPLGEARLLLLELLEHATRPEFVYSHRWSVGDVVFFDNRSVLHRVRRFDLSERRELTRAATLDDVPPLRMTGV